MANIYVSNLDTPRIYRNKRNYNGGDVTTTVLNTFNKAKETKYPEKSIIDFYDTDQPQIIDWEANYSEKHGQFPLLTLRTFDENGDLIQRMEPPKLYMLAHISNIDDTIDYVQWDLPEVCSGYIIIY